ncbi:MAG: hypothetical protein ACRDRL_14165, partial [Sciscionella sp.]
VLQWVDAVRYLRVDPRGFFADPWSPAGYPAFLAIVRFITPVLSVTTAAQDVLGLIGGVFVYLTVRRIATPPWLGMIPAAIPLLSGDYLFLEHILMSETLFMTLTFAALYAAVRSRNAAHPRLWLGVAGIVMAASALVRPLTLVLPIVIASWAVWVHGGTARARVTAALSCLGPAGVVIGLYMAVALSIGPYAGIGDMSGWDLYARAAPFAQCSAFTPPPGTRGLCQAVPPAQRPGPFYYDWEATSPGRRLFPHTPAGARMVGRWARAAILAEPGAYLKAVVKDLARYVDPSIGAVREYSGIPYALYQFSYRSPAEERLIGRAIETRGYTDVLPVNASGMTELEDYQTIFHIDGLPILAFVALAIMGLWLCRGLLREGIALLTASAFLLYLLPTLTLSYDVRYGWPPAPVLAAAGVLSAYGMVLRYLDRPPGGSLGRGAPVENGKPVHRRWSRGRWGRSRT